MQDMTGTYAAVRWTTTQFDEHPYPEVLITKADNPQEAQIAFNEHIKQHGLDWDTYDMEVHLGDAVAQLTLDPPEEEDEQ